jgi:hypothetical protein
VNQYTLTSTITKGIITQFQLQLPNDTLAFQQECLKTINLPFGPDTFAYAFQNTPFQHEAFFNQFF